MPDPLVKEQKLTHLSPVPRRRGARAATAAIALLTLSPAIASADVAQNQPGWSTTTQSLYTGITQGYELAVDTGNRRLYAADAGGLTTQKSTVTKVPVYGADGVATGEYTNTTVNSTAKVVALNTINNSFVKSFSYLTIPDLVVPSSNPVATRAAFPYGVAVDSQRHIVVTTNTRSNSVTIFDQDRTAALDAASTLYLDGASTPYFAHPMSVGVDSSTGRAYVADNQANQVEVIDLVTKTVVATIPGVPSPTKLAIDEANGLAYVGSGAERAATQPIVTILDLKTNAVIGTLTSPNAGDTNTRPGIDTVAQKLYVGSYAGKSVSVYDLATGTFLERIDVAGPANTVTVDSQRHLAYSADHSANTVSVIDTTTDEVVQVVPTAARPIAVAIDPASGVAYASSQTSGTVTAIKVTKDADLPKGDTGAAGPAGPSGATGPAGPAGPAGVGAASTTLGTLSLSYSLGAIEVVGSSASIKVPGAGTTKVVVTSGKTTIATGSKSSTKAGTIKVTLKKTAAGKKLLAGKKSVSATLAATFSPKKAAAVRVTRSVKVRYAR